MPYPLRSAPPDPRAPKGYFSRPSAARKPDLLPDMKPEVVPDTTPGALPRSLPGLQSDALPGAVSDAARCAVEQAIRRVVRCPQLHIVIDEGTVTLTGVVASAQDKSRAGFACWCDPLVHAVQNDLTVQPSSVRSLQ